MPVSITSNSYDPADYLEAEILLNRRFSQGLSTHSQTLHLGNCTASDVLAYVSSLLPGSLSIQDTGEESHVSHIVTPDESHSCWVSVSKAGEMITVTVKGDRHIVHKVADSVGSQFARSPVYVKWVYGGEGESTKLPLDQSCVPQTHFYPQLGTESLDSYYDRFAASRSNVLVLFGPPGTGKTSFIKGFLLRSGLNALISYDPSILEKDGIFASFLSGRENVMVLEDADNFLGARSKGNTVMHRFLNVGDGLISTSTKKIIFTTNLPSIKDVDEALLRPGRCFDVMKFGKLSPQQAAAIRPGSHFDSDVTLAQVLGEGGHANSVNKVGFV